jgi:hypothetical protein
MEWIYWMRIDVRRDVDNCIICGVGIFETWRARRTRRTVVSSMKYFNSN